MKDKIKFKELSVPLKIGIGYSIFQLIMMGVYLIIAVMMFMVVMVGSM